MAEVIRERSRVVMGRLGVERVGGMYRRAEEMDIGKGIQLGVSGENTKVVKFYEKVGFRVYPGGEKEENVWMVRDL